MRLTYDPKHNIAYLRLAEKSDTVTTIQLSGELNVDMSADGKIYGIEFLNANEQLQKTDNGKLVIVDSVTDKNREVSLT